MKARMIQLTGILLVLGSVSGCMTRTQHINVDQLVQRQVDAVLAERLQRENASLQAQCRHVDVVLSSLSKPATERSYFLKPGVRCDL